MIQPRGHCVHQASQPREEPSVEHVPLSNRNLRLRGIEVIQSRVGDEERIAVPERDEELLHDLAQHRVAGAVVLAHLR